MPMSGWNGKFHSAGGAEGANSAVGGSINYAPMRAALRRGYATAGTDGGHQGATLGFAPGHPEKLVDLAHRLWTESCLTRTRARGEARPEPPIRRFL